MLVVIFGRAKTGKTTLAKLLAAVSDATVCDDQSIAHGALLKVIEAHPSTKPLVVVVPEPKGSTLPVRPYGSSKLQAMADIVVHLSPDRPMEIVQQRGGE